MQLVKFRNWLEKPATAFEIIYLSVGIFAADIIYTHIVVALLLWLNRLPDTPADAGISSGSLVVTYILAALWEELVFRIIPLTYVLRRWKTGANTLWTLAISSVIFGFMHGGFVNIPVQGVVGLLYGLLFIKLSNVGMRPIFAGTAVVIIHVAFNFLIFAIFALGRF